VECIAGLEIGCMNIERLSRFLGYCAKAPNTVGVVPTFQWIFGTAQLNLNIAVPRILNVRPRFLEHPVKLRARTSDPFIFRQIMIESEYLPLKDLRVATILDLGANIGLSSAWFLNCFPDATVFAVEADAENCAACRDNLAAYGTRARVLHGAAWSSREMLTLHRYNSAADNFVKHEGDTGEGQIQVQGWDIASLIEMSGFAQIDLLKIDIEGAEEAIFRSNASAWLPRVHNLCIELHGKACRDAFFEALADYDFERGQSGELDLCINLRSKVLV
jgi:FkbM family methyltransferase